MKLTMKKFTPFLFALSLILLSGCLDKKTDGDNVLTNIEITDAYAFATMPGALTGAAFMQIKNISDVDDALIGVESNIAAINEIHQNMIDPDDGTMMMRKVNKIDVAAGQGVTLEPKGYHVMFIKMTEPLTLGETLPLTLIFEKAGAVSVEVKITPPGGNPEHAHH